MFSLFLLQLLTFVSLVIDFINRSSDNADQTRSLHSLRGFSRETFMKIKWELASIPEILKKLHFDMDNAKKTQKK